MALNLVKQFELVTNMLEFEFRNYLFKIAYADVIFLLQR